MKGAANIDNTMLANTGFSKCGGTKLCCAPKVSNTKPNSPACARYRPVRKDTPMLLPVAWAIVVTSPSLNSTGKVVSSSTKGQF